MLRLSILFLALTGCAGTEARALLRPRPGVMARQLVTDEDCRRMLGARRTWGALGAGAAFAGGSGGIAAAFPQDGNARYAVGGASLAVGIAGAAFMFVSSSLGEDFNRYCTTNAQGGTR